jgi:hypothetical protein
MINIFRQVPTCSGKLSERRKTGRFLLLPSFTLLTRATAAQHVLPIPYIDLEWRAMADLDR